MIIPAAVLLLVAGLFVLWPLLRPAAPEQGALQTEPDAEDRERSRALEELDLDVASGRLSRPEAEARRREAGL